MLNKFKNKLELINKEIFFELISCLPIKKKIKKYTSF